MKIKFFTLVLLLFAIFKLNAQTDVKRYVYKGKIGNFPVTMYLIETTDACPSTSYRGMYKYDNVSKWIYLNIQHNGKGRMAMVEERVTGIMSLKKTGAALQGFWLAPDTSKKLSVDIKEIPITNKTVQEYEKIMEQLNYELSDC